ncbi:hypothetical protein C8A03DRAFT_18665 [Achaetomium macrosporum]|uniref:Uncharacterized protein n=1 Tax=Achaetomium macrosporum TaxID=79813 RepID=A0AAN7C340_9PEZI|nr:hypothetical protein C8A03DRAFT_18665 [Achaetomium macrosporum]
MQHSQRPGEALECGACVASTTPAGEMQGIEELLRHAMEKHSSGQAVTNVAGRKRKRDGDMDGEYTAPAAKRKEGGDDGEHTAPAAVRKRAAKHNVAYKKCNGLGPKDPSPFVVYDTDSDLCEDVIVCASTVDEQQTCYPTRNRTGLSAILDSKFLGQVEPALLAP